MDFDKYIHVSIEKLNKKKQIARNEVKRENAQTKAIAAGKQVWTYNREKSNKTKSMNAQK